MFCRYMYFMLGDTKLDYSKFSCYLKYVFVFFSALYDI